MGEKLGEVVDEALVSYFARGRSYTGEPTCEISCHGSPVINEILIRQLVEAGARVADPGEFTYRAFLGGRLDLIQAESVLSLIHSQSPRAAALALRQLQGELSPLFQNIKDRLEWMLAHLEASIDFSTEDLEVMDYGENFRGGEKSFTGGLQTTT